jgi:hypothetical protein
METKRGTTARVVDRRRSSEDGESGSVFNVNRASSSSSS